MRISDDGMSAVRGIAALVVVVAHAIQIFVIRLIGIDHLIARVAGQMAAHAVFVFFIVSGFLITSSIIKNIQRNGGAFNLVEYASARISRIYPPLIFAILTSLALYFLMRLLGMPGNDSVGAAPYGLPNDLYAARESFKIGLNDIVNALLMNNGLLQVDGPLWSLCVEWRIYIVVGSVAMLMTSKVAFRKVFWVGILVISIIKLAAIDSNAYFYLLIWLAGSCVALGDKYGIRFHGLLRSVAWIAPLSIATALLFANPELVLKSRQLSNYRDYVFQFICCMVWINLLFPRDTMRETLSRRILMKLGDFSYTLFIIHFPIMLFILAVLQNRVGYSLMLSTLLAMFAIGLTLIISYWIGKYVERRDIFMPAIVRTIQRILLEVKGIVSDLAPKQSGS